MVHAVEDSRCHQRQAMRCPWAAACEMRHPGNSCRPADGMEHMSDPFSRPYVHWEIIGRFAGLKLGDNREIRTALWNALRGHWEAHKLILSYRLLVWLSHGQLIVGCSMVSHRGPIGQISSRSHHQGSHRGLIIGKISSRSYHRGYIEVSSSGRSHRGLIIGFPLRFEAPPPRRQDCPHGEPRLH